MTLSGKQFAGTLRNEIRYVALLLTLCFASVALSSELPRLYVRPGENIVVARSEKEIELNASSSQDVKLTSDAAVNTQAKLWVLSFKAPPEKDTSEVSVVYSIGTDKYSVIIQVSAT